MLLDRPALDVVALAAAAAAVLALAACALLLVRLGRLRRAYDALVAGEPGASFEAAVTRQARTTGALQDEVRVLREDLAAARADLSDALRHVAVVRYDAFGDMGGRMSFSAALLDDGGDGLVLTSINGRTETRSYAKGVTAGGSEHALSPEEQEAIAHATRPAPRRRARA